MAFSYKASLDLGSGYELGLWLLGEVLAVLPFPSLSRGHIVGFCLSGTTYYNDNITETWDARCGSGLMDLAFT